MSEIDRAEVRRLLDEATPGPWVAEVSGTTGPVVMDVQSVSALDHVAKCPHYRGLADSELIAAAVNALPDLLDALEKAESAIERVRALHYAADNDSARTPRCEECQGRAGVHPCGCWAEVDREPVCGHCAVRWFGQRVPWPCPTIQALDGVAPMSDLRAALGGRYEALASAISETVSDWLGTPYSPHGWRCEDKTRYPGPCGHDGDMTGEVMAVLGDILPDLLAKAWDEGFTAGVNAVMRDVAALADGSWHTNPYRQEADQHE